MTDTSTSWAAMYEEAGEADQPMPDSEYDFVVMKSEHKKSSNGKDMYVIRAAVESGPYARRVIFHNFVVTPDNPTSMQIFFRQMGALGLGKSFWQTNPSHAQVAAALLNRRFRGTVGSKLYQGIDRNEIKGFRAAGTAGVATAPPPPPPGPGAGAPPPPPQYAPPTQEAAPPPQPPAPSAGPTPAATPPPPAEMPPPPPPPPAPEAQAPPAPAPAPAPAPEASAPTPPPPPNGQAQQPEPAPEPVPATSATLPPPPAPEDPPF